MLLFSNPCSWLRKNSVENCILTWFLEFSLLSPLDSAREWGKERFCIVPRFLFFFFFVGVGGAVFVYFLRKISFCMRGCDHLLEFGHIWLVEMRGMKSLAPRPSRKKEIFGPEKGWRNRIWQHFLQFLYYFKSCRFDCWVSMLFRDCIHADMLCSEI